MALSIRLALCSGLLNMQKTTPHWYIILLMPPLKSWLDLTIGNPTFVLLHHSLKSLKVCPQAQDRSWSNWIKGHLSQEHVCVTNFSFRGSCWLISFTRFVGGKACLKAFCLKLPAALLSLSCSEGLREKRCTFLLWEKLGCHKRWGKTILYT